MKEAIQLLQNALTKHPADLDERLVLADIYMRTGATDQAEEELKQGLRFHPESSAAAFALGTLYLNRGALSEAERVLTDAVERHPQSANARTQLATVLAGEHKYKEAAEKIRAVQPPAEPEALVHYFRLKASIESGLGDRHAAAAAMEQALHASPNDPQLQLLASYTDASAEEWTKCIEHAGPLFAQNPTAANGLLLLRAELGAGDEFASTLEQLQTLTLPQDQKLDLLVRSAELLASAEKHTESARQFQEALKISAAPDPNLLFNLAVEQSLSGQYEAALSSLESLRKLQDSAEAEDLEGEVQQHLGNSTAAIRSYQDAVTLAPGEERYRLSLGAAWLHYRSYGAAAQVFREAVQMFPQSTRSYVGLGTADYFMEKYDESVAAFLRADQLDGSSGRALSYLGATQAESAAGPSPDAVRAICNRSDSHPKEAATAKWCGALLFRKAYLAGDTAAAAPAIQRLRVAAGVQPNDPITSCWLGRALDWTEQSPEARHWLEICVRLRPDSTEDHYALSRVYQKLGLKDAAAQQSALIAKLATQKDSHDAITGNMADEILDEKRTPHAAK